jgi:putative transposase
MRLVYNRASRRYEWHLVITTEIPLPIAPGNNVAAVDLGEVHPAALTDGTEALVVSCRQLRAQSQHTAKNLASLQHKQSQHRRGSRRWKRLQRRKNRFLAKQALRRRDIEHKVSREVVSWAVERAIGQLFIGDVRDVADGKRLNRKNQQKIATWSHGRLRRYIGYKAEAAGVAVDDEIPEHYTSQTCPQCQNRYKPSGRNYRCPVCGFCSHRDVVGASNILSRAVYGELGKVRPPQMVKYRHPVVWGKRSSPGHGASSSAVAR